MSFPHRPLNRREKIIVFLYRQYPVPQSLSRISEDDVGGNAARLRIYEINKRIPNGVIEPERRMYTLNLVNRKHF